MLLGSLLLVVMLDRPRSEVKWKSTGYPLHSPVSPLLPLPCATVCHQVSNALYYYYYCYYYTIAIITTIITFIILHGYNRASIISITSLSN